MRRAVPLILLLGGFAAPATSRAGGEARFQLVDETPRVARVLSVDDDIRLEYDFRLIPADTEP